MNKIHNEIVLAAGFVRTKKPEIARKRVREKDIAAYEKELGMKFGAQLRDYLKKYGYISYRGVTLLGITRDGNENMLTQSQRARKVNRSAKDLAAIETDEGDTYILVDSEDKVYFGEAHNFWIEDLNMTLYEWLLSRFAA